MNGWRERHDLWWVGLLLAVSSAAIVGLIGWAILALIFTASASELLIAVVVFAAAVVAFLAAVFVLTNRIEDRRR